MPKIRAGRRHHLYKSKNSEWKRQTLQTITNTIDNRDAIDLFEGLKQELSSSLLSGWHVFANSDTIQMSSVSNSPPEPSVVRIILTVHKHFKWAVHVYGKVVPSNSGFVKKFPTCFKNQRRSTPHLYKPTGSCFMRRKQWWLLYWVGSEERCMELSRIVQQQLFYSFLGWKKSHCSSPEELWDYSSRKGPM